MAGNARKVGNNKKACETYEKTGRQETNKAKHIKRAARQEGKAAAKIDRRIKAGKPVPSKHIARRGLTSNGKTILLPEANSLEDVEEYARRHRLKGTAEVVEVPQGQKMVRRFKLENVRKAA